MFEQQYLKDNYELNEIENLSKQISDLINLGNYSQIEELDRIRLELIKNFKDKNNKNFQNLVNKISLKNTDNIDMQNEIKKNICLDYGILNDLDKINLLKKDSKSYNELKDKIINVGEFNN